MLIYKEFFKNAKIGKMLLKIGYVKLLIFCLRVFIEGEMLTVNYPKISQSSMQISRNLSQFAIHDDIICLIYGLHNPSSTLS